MESQQWGMIVEAKVKLEINRQSKAFLANGRIPLQPIDGRREIKINEQQTI